MSKHRKATRVVRTKVQHNRHANLTLDAQLLRELILRLWHALPPGSTISGEKLGKVGRRSASPANLNVAAHDLLVDIVTGIADLAMRARDIVGDETQPSRTITDQQADATLALLPAKERTTEALAVLRRHYWSEAFTRAWTRAQRPRRHAEFRDAYHQLGRLPDLLDRLHGQHNDPDAEQLAQRISRDVDRWVNGSQQLLGMLSRDTYEIERRCPEKGFIRTEDQEVIPDCNGIIRVNRTSGVAKCTNRGWHSVTGIRGEWDDQSWRKIVKPDEQQETG